MLNDNKHTASEYEWIPVGRQSSKSGKANGSSSKGGKTSSNLENSFEALSSENEICVPVQYKNKWILDSASSGNYGDRRTKVKHQQKLK